MSGFRIYALAIKALPDEYVDDGTVMASLPGGCLAATNPSQPPIIFNPADVEWFMAGSCVEGAGHVKH